MTLLTNRNRKIKFEHYTNFLTLRKNFTWIQINDVCSYRILCVCFVVASLALYLCDDSFVKAYEFSVECRGASNLVDLLFFFLAFLSENICKLWKKLEIKFYFNCRGNQSAYSHFFCVLHSCVVLHEFNVHI